MNISYLFSDGFLSAVLQWCLTYPVDDFFFSFYSFLSLCISNLQACVVVCTSTGT